MIVHFTFFLNIQFLFLGFVSLHYFYLKFILIVCFWFVFYWQENRYHSNYISILIIIAYLFSWKFVSSSSHKLMHQLSFLSNVSIHSKLRFAYKTYDGFHEVITVRKIQQIWLTCKDCCCVLPLLL